MRGSADARRITRALAATLLAVVLAGGSAARSNAAILPPKPTGLTVTGTTATSISLRWDSGLLASSYGVYRDGTHVADTAQTTYTVAGLACGTTYTIGVDAADLLGNRSDQATIGAQTGACESPPPPPPPPGGGEIRLVEEGWTCTGPVDLSLVKVTLRTAGTDAINLQENCSGRIGRIEIETWQLDGVKVNAIEPVAHDLVIEGGYIRCYDHPAGAHQDGIQAMAGRRITFRNLEINCNSEPNAQLFVNAANGGYPTDIVCDACFLGSGAATTLRVNQSVRSGARNTLLCPGRYGDTYFGPPAQQPVNENNSVLPASDPRC